MTPLVSVCICTRHRPVDLRDALRSLESSRSSLAQIIVSDDGPSEATRIATETARIPVRYIIGPQQGLAANRNHALAFVSAPYVLFLDDDSRLAPVFLDRALACMRDYEERYGKGEVIVSGAEQQRTGIVEPGGQTFLGFQCKAPDRTVGLKSVVINSTLFPTGLVRRHQFDARLRYGSEEVDLATRLVARGATIVYCREAVNLHLPSPVGRSDYALARDASRLYATMKLYAFTDRNLAKACAFFLLAPIHNLAAGLRRGGLREAAKALQATWTAAKYMGSFIAETCRGRRGVDIPSQ